jgi:hypothetical protein
MPETELSSLEYLSRAFKGLSYEKKDNVLNTARSLLKIQDDNKYPVERNEPLENVQLDSEQFTNGGNYEHI